VGTKVGDDRRGVVANGEEVRERKKRIEEKEKRDGVDGWEKIVQATGYGLILVEC